MSQKFSTVKCPYCGKRIWLTVWPEHVCERGGSKPKVPKAPVDKAADDAYDRSMDDV